MKNTLHIGWCPNCNHGWVDIVKDSNHARLLLLCDECDTVWEKPEDISLNKPATDILTGLISAPTLEEVQRVEWDKYIVSKI